MMTSETSPSAPPTGAGAGFAAVDLLPEGNQIGLGGNQIRVIGGAAGGRCQCRQGKQRQDQRHNEPQRHGASGLQKGFLHVV